MGKLKSSDYTLDPIVQLERGRVARATAPEMGPLAGSNEDADESGNEGDEDDGEAAPAAAAAAPEAPTPVTPKAADGEEKAAAEEVAAAASARAQADDDAPWGVVVCKTRRGLHRSLHQVGSCWRVPGVHDKKF